MVIKTISYQELREEDFSDIIKLMNVLGNRPEDNSVTKEDIERTMSQSANTIIAAIKDDQIIGLTILIEIHGFTAKLGIVDEVIVSEDHRRQGIGLVLLEEVIKIAKEKKMFLLKTDTNKDNAANSLYQKVGFKLREDNLYKLFL